MLLQMKAINKKFFIVMLVILILYMQSFIMPKQKAEGAVAALAFSGSMSFMAGATTVLAGPVGLALFAVAAGVTVYALYHEEINSTAIQIATSTATGIEEAWNAMDEATRNAWNTMASGWDATKDNVINLSGAMVDSIVNFFEGTNIAVKPLELNDNFPYVAILNTGETVVSGADYDTRTIFSNEEVQAYGVLKGQALDINNVMSTYVFMPVQWKYNVDHNNAVLTLNAFYNWVKLQADGTWKNEGLRINNAYVGGVQVFRSSLNTVTTNGFNYSEVIKVAFNNVADQYLNLEYAISHYKKILVDTFPDFVVDWSAPDVYDPVMDRLMERAKTQLKDKSIAIPVPAGTIVNTGTQTEIKGLTTTQVGTMAEAIPTSISTPIPSNPTFPNIDDPGTPALNIVTTRFPFSLPWDVYRVVNLLSAEPKPLVINVNENLMGMPFKFQVNLQFLDPYMPFFRFFITIGFAVMLIFRTRSLLGGGQ